MAHDTIQGLFFQFCYKISEILSWSAFGNQCCTQLSFHLLIQQMLIVSLLRADNIIGFRARIVSRHLHSHTVHFITVNILLSP